MHFQNLRIAAFGAVLLSSGVCVAEDAPAAPPLIPVNPQVSAVVGRSVAGEVPVRQRRAIVDRNVQPAAAQSETTANGAPPPVPMEPDAPATAAAPAATPSYVTGVPVPFAPPFSGPSAFHNRLRARRLARVQQMRRDAEAAGDVQGAQRAQYLEGMVNQLHQKGLFNFGQEVIGAIQQGKLTGQSILGGGASDSPATSSSVELPEADLGAPAALPGTELGEPGTLPESDLGQPAPVPTDESSSAPEAPSQPETAPELPPASP